MKLAKQGAIRLLTLADQLESLDGLADNLFDMDDWFSDPDDLLKQAGKYCPLNPAELRDCNSTACAIGFATLNPTFKRAGLKYGAKGPTFKGHFGWRAVAAFFGLPDGYYDAPHKITRHLFGPAEARTPAQEVEVLRRFVRKYAPAAYRAHYAI